ncbi:MAG: DUF2071 domain-containing protein [Saprospiraceae bacterium]|nr:DUF2071 domain-containing protein [Saprospiraceae bacterium]
MDFLTAQWKKLAIANFEVDPGVLAPFIPAKTELDLWNGSCYVSLVGFMFLNTRLKGFRIPFHVNFEEVNLRFYVKYNDNGNWKRGVVFIKEIVPKPAITLVANLIYKERYETMKMAHTWKKTENDLQVEYRWKCKNKWQKLSLTADHTPREMAAGSEAEFITEHYWGYSKPADDKTVEYEVRHPRWKIFDIKSFELDVDFGLVYGNTFAFLNQQTPKSVMLAEGSEIEVMDKKLL